MRLVTVLVWLAASTMAVAAASGVYKDKAFTEFFRRTNGIVATDGGFSVPLSDGRVLWLFGDSYVDCWRDGTVPCLFQVRNAAMLHHRDNLTDAQSLIGQHAGIKSFFKRSAAEDPWFWPVSGFQHSNTVYVYLTELKKAGSGPLGFARTDQDYLAKMNFPELRVTAYLPLPSFNGIDFGAGFVPERDHTLTFGHRRHGLRLSLYVARFLTARPDTNWTFWDGKQWTPNVTNAAPVTAQDATSMSICKIKDKFLLTSSQFSVGCDQGKEIYISTSESATGPFSSRRRIFTIDDTIDGHYPFFYLPVAHPEFTNARDEVLITYCINGYEPCARTCVNGRMDPDHYRPRAIRVPMKLIAE